MTIDRFADMDIEQLLACILAADDCDEQQDNIDRIIELWHAKQKS